MKEKDIIPTVAKWLLAHKGTCVFEVKYSRTRTLRKDALAEHQYRALMLASGIGHYHKIVDCGYQNPYDGFVVKGVPAFVVVWWEKERAFSVTHIKDWVSGSSFPCPPRSELIIYPQITAVRP